MFNLQPLKRHYMSQNASKIIALNATVRVENNLNTRGLPKVCLVSCQCLYVPGGGLGPLILGSLLPLKREERRTTNV